MMLKVSHYHGATKDEIKRLFIVNKSHRLVVKLPMRFFC